MMTAPEEELNQVDAAGPAYFGGQITCLDCPANWQTTGGVEADPGPDTGNAYDEAERHAREQRHVVHASIRAEVTFWPWEERLKANFPGDHP